MHTGTFIIVSAVLLVLLTGCTREPIKADIKDYAKRLANVLDHPIALTPSADTLHFPSADELRLDIPKTTINLTDFYALEHCSVSTLIAQRNTVLGKIQLPSTRFDYEVKLIKGLQRCLTSSDADEQIDALNSWLTQKRNNLTLVWVDLIQNSSETKRTMASNQGYFNAQGDAVLKEYIGAWEYLISLQDQQDNLDIERLETVLNLLRQTPLLAQIWRTQSLLSNQLEQLNKQLLDLVPHIQCESGHNPQQLEYLQNVFRLFFIERIQPLAGQLDQHYYALSATLKSLQTNTHLSHGFTHFIETRQITFELYRARFSEHVVIWQNLFSRCNISPV